MKVRCGGLSVLARHTSPFVTSEFSDTLSIVSNIHTCFNVDWNYIDYVIQFNISIKDTHSFVWVVSNAGQKRHLLASLAHSPAFSFNNMAAPTESCTLEE